MEYNVLDILSFIIAVTAFVLSLISFKTNQKWKVLEFAGNEIKSLKENAYNQAALKMLDWNAAKYSRINLTENDEQKIITIKDEDLINGLGPINGTSKYSIEEKFVRDCFDQFLDSLETLEIHIEENLVPFEKYQPYLKYYMDIINGKTKRKPKKVLDAINAHMTEFNYDKAINFCQRFA